MTQSEQSEDHERRYHTAILANLAEGLQLTRVADGIIVYTNPRFDRMFGYEPGELIGLSVVTLNAPMPDKSPAEVAREIITALAEKGAWSGEIQNITKQGVVFWCQAHVSEYLHPEFGRVWISIHEDITDRKQAEAALRKSEHRLRLIADNVPALISYVDESLRYRFVNSGYEWLFGKTPEQIVGFPVRDVMGDALFTQVQPYMLKALSGQRVSYEASIPRNQEVVILAVEYVPEIDSRGVTRGFYFLGSDITKRKRTEDALRHSEERYRTILQTAMDGFWLLDAEGRLLQVNNAYCRMSDYSAQELATMRVADLEVPTGAPGVLSRIEQGGAATAGRLECRHRRKDGSCFDVEVSIQYRATDGGQFVAFLRDISERKRAEAERDRLENQLQQARKMEAIGQLAGAIAHDFNNILTTVTLQLENLLEAVEIYDDALPPMVDDIMASVHRAADFTKQILLFSRQQPIKTTRYDPNVILRKVTGLLTRLLGEQVNLVVTYCHEPLWVEGDVGMFEQVITNLCINARDAMPTGGTLAIEVCSVQLDVPAVKGYSWVQPGPFVCVRVSDSGVGIPTDILGRIFEPFFTTKQPGKGTGLGLATVHGIVSKHHGFVDVASQVSRGSTFRVFLPRAQPPLQKVQPQPGASAADLGGNERILVVEDEPALRRLIVANLSRLGYRVVEAATGAEALAQWEDDGEGFDLLLTDMVMPGGMSGLELSKQLKLRCPGLKTIISSGYSPTALEDDSARPADVMYLAKPYGINVLLRAVRAGLDRKR